MVKDEIYDILSNIAKFTANLGYQFTFTLCS